MAVKRTPEQEEVVKNRGGALLVSAARVKVMMRNSSIFRPSWRM